MKLPGLDRAVVSPSKVHGYLLSDAHPVGRFKAAFFRALGYSSSDWELLSEALRRHAAENPASALRASPHGQKYEVRGTLLTPRGKVASIVVVWIVLHGEDAPRFVTAFPGAKP